MDTKEENEALRKANKLAVDRAIELELKLAARDARIKWLEERCAESSALMVSRGTK